MIPYRTAGRSRKPETLSRNDILAPFVLFRFHMETGVASGKANRIKENIMLRLILSLCLIAAPAFAQTVPDAAEIAAFPPLHRAVHDGDTETIRRLIAEGADVNARDRRRRTPAHIAAFASRDAALTVLAEAGANLNALDGEAYDLVTIAAVADDPQFMSHAIDLGNDPGLMTSRWDGTALIAAAHLGHAEVVRRLIDAGAPLDHINNLGWTALIEAVVLGDGGENHRKVVRALIGAGADASIADRDGATPLMLAEARGYSEIARLIRAGR